MCQVAFNIETEEQNIQQIEGRYKLQTNPTFEPVFQVNDINNPMTPNITVIGTYDLEIRIKSNNGQWSEWFSTVIEVSNLCGVNSIPIYIKQSKCNGFPIDTDDILVYVDNADFVDGSTILYADASLTIPYGVPSIDTNFIYGDNGVTQDNIVFNISNTGEVQNITLCSNVLPESKQVSLYVVTDETDGFPSVPGLIAYISGSLEAINSNTVFYTSNQLTTTFNGQSSRYRVLFSSNTEAFRGWHESFIINGVGETSSLQLCLNMTLNPIPVNSNLNSYVGQLNIEGTGIDKLDIQVIGIPASISSFGLVFNSISNFVIGLTENVNYQIGNNGTSSFIFANTGTTSTLTIIYKAYINGNFSWEESVTIKHTA